MAEEITLDNKTVVHLDYSYYSPGKEISIVFENGWDYGHLYYLSPQDAIKLAANLLSMAANFQSTNP